MLVFEEPVGRVVEVILAVGKRGAQDDGLPGVDRGLETKPVPGHVCLVVFPQPRRLLEILATFKIYVKIVITNISFGPLVGSPEVQPGEKVAIKGTREYLILLVVYLSVGSLRLLIGVP